MDIFIALSQVTVTDIWCFHDYVLENYCFFRIKVV